MDEILARLERIERRLDALEARTVRPVPPIYAPPQQAPPASGGANDLESIVGTRWLPRAGAVAVIAAIAYLVGLGLQRGVVTPATVAWGIAIVCAGVALLGSRMKDSRKAFGNVLVGLGAGGLYVDAVGSNLYREMLSGEAMVAACVAISLATLAFGALRAVPSFLGIGLFGGLVAAVMPLSKGLGPVPAAIFALVAIPAFAVAAYRRWTMQTMAVWVACTLTGLAFLFSVGPLTLRLFPLDLALLVGIGAWTYASEKPAPLDPQGAFPFVAATFTGLVSLSVWNGFQGSAHVALLGLGIVTLGYIFARRQTGRLAQTSGLVLTLVVAPLGLYFYRIPWVLALLAIGEAALFRRRLNPLIAIQAVLAAGIYGALLLLEWSKGDISLPIGEEIGLIAALAASSVAAAVLLDLREGRLAAGAIVWGLSTRLVVIGTDLPVGMAVTVAWLTTFILLLGFGFARRLSELRQLGLVIAAATIGKVALIDLAGVDAAVKAAILLGLGVALLGGGYTYVRWSSSQSKEPEL